MTATFTIKFKEHLASQEVSNLKGILQLHGIGCTEASGDYVLEVHRKSRVARARATLKHWDRLGWLKWSSGQDSI